MLFLAVALKAEEFRAKREAILQENKESKDVEDSIMMDTSAKVISHCLALNCVRTILMVKKDVSGCLQI